MFYDAKEQGTDNLEANHENSEEEEEVEGNEDISDLSFQQKEKQL